MGATVYIFMGGVKNCFLPNEEGVHRILRGPGQGIQILTNPVRGGTRVVLGLYEPCLMNWLLKVVRPGSVVYDIGSADGHEALIAAQLAGPDGLVFAFEPSEDARRQLQANLDLNPVLAGRIHVVPFFVGNQYDPDHGIVSIDKFYQQPERYAPAPDVVKIDVEGAELKVLEGMEELAHGQCPHTFVECHLGLHVEKAVRSFFARHSILTQRAVPSLFDVGRQDFNSWVWTVKN